MDPALAATEASGPLSAADGPLDRPSSAPAVCARCEHVNAPGSRFCNRCGAPLLPSPDPADPERAPEAPARRPPSDVGRQALLVVGIGLAAVVGLYAVSVWSDRNAPPPAAPEAAPGVGAAAPIPDGPPPPLAADEQAEADRLEALGTAEGWYEAGRYYLTAAFLQRETDPASSVRWARRAAEDFQKSIDLKDDDEVRLALAESSMFDPTAPPMRPIQEVQTILARSPDHPGALFMQGELRLMRAEMQPAWLDSARTSFSRVLEVAPAGDPVRQRAEDRLAEIAGRSAAAAPPPGP